MYQLFTYCYFTKKSFALKAHMICAMTLYFYLFIYSFIHSFLHLFIPSFIYLLSYINVSVIDQLPGKRPRSLYKCKFTKVKKNTNKYYYKTQLHENAQGHRYNN